MITAKIDRDLRNADWLHGAESDLASTIERVQQAALSEGERHAMFYRLAHPEERSGFARSHGGSFHSIGRPTGHAVSAREIDRYHPTKPLHARAPEIGRDKGSDPARIQAYLAMAFGEIGHPVPRTGPMNQPLVGGSRDFEALFSPVTKGTAFSAGESGYDQLVARASAAIAHDSGIFQPADVQEFLDHWQGGERLEPWATLQQAAADHFDVPLEGQIAERVRGLKLNNMHYGPILAVARAYLPLQHQHTLAWYRQQNITHVDLFRGVAFEPGERPGSWNQIPASWESRALAQPPLSSWTNSMQMAREFAGGVWGTSTTNPYAERYLLSARVPVERIVGNGITGLGAPWQGEHVIIGGTLNLAVKRED